MELPVVRSYGNYSNSNYGAHCLFVRVPGVISLWYSYQTIIAFTFRGERYVTQNIWGSTTGKHLNMIDGGNRNERLDRNTFITKLDEVMKEVGAIEWAR